MKNRQSRTPRVLARFGPQLGLSLGQITDRERFVVVGVRELFGDQTQPTPRIAGDYRSSDAAPALVLVDLARYVAAAIFGAQRRKTSGLRQGANREVPAAVRRDEGAAV